MLVRSCDRRLLIKPLSMEYHDKIALDGVSMSGDDVVDEYDDGQRGAYRKNFEYDHRDEWLIFQLVLTMFQPTL